LNRHREGLEQIALVTSQEPEFEPPRDVVHKRLGVADFWISGPTAGLEAHVAEFFAKHAQWHAELGKREISKQSFEIHNALVDGDRVAMEVLWQGRLANPAGDLPVGGEMRAHFAIFLEFRDGKIVAQRSYECFEPF
jgi:ketosteroid isomerase-like protein